MANILLLYDTTEKDLARDFKDLLDELNVGPIIMIPSSPDKGLTLEDKEEYYLKDAIGIIFILTPGAERLGSMYPSPSVSHEMGQVKEKFRENPRNVIYLVDKHCDIPAIDQKSYLFFERNDIRSVIECITALIKNLKDAGLYRTTPIPREIKSHPEKVDIQKLIQDIGQQTVNIIFDISNKVDGQISEKDLLELLHAKYNLNMRQINFIKKDLEKHKLAGHRMTGEPSFFNHWILTEAGWDIVRHEDERRKKEASKRMGFLSNLSPLERSLSNMPTSGLLGGLFTPKKKSIKPTCPNCSSDIKKIYMSPIPSDFIDIENVTHECSKCGYKTKI